MKLYEIPAIIEEVLERGFALDGETGEVWDMSDLDSLQMALEDKVEATACYVKNLDAEAAAIKAEEQNLAKRRKALEARADRTRDYITRCMVRSGTKKVETPKCLLRTRRTERVEVYDEDELPDLFKKPKLTWSADKAELKRRLKNGEAIPGCALVAGESLTIK